MADDPIKTLGEARRSLVDERRKCVNLLASLHARTGETDLDRNIELIVKIQAAIDVVDKAVSDEKQVAIDELISRSSTSRIVTGHARPKR